MYGIDFPVAASGTIVHDGGPFRDHAFTGKAAAAVFAAIAFTAVFSQVAQVQVERASLFAISPNPAIDRVVAHDGDALALGSSDYLLGAQITAQEALDVGKVVWPVSLVAARASQSPTIELAGGRVPVEAVVSGDVARQFATDRARIATQRPGDRSVRQAL